MSYLNINYSTLEDAWGGNFERKKKSRGNKSDVCDLYNNRNAKIYKPYKTSPQESTHIAPIYTEEDYVKYHGYKDGRPYSRKTNKLSKYDVRVSRNPRKIVSNNYVSDEEEEEDFEEADVQPIIKRSHHRKKPFVKTPFSYIDDESSMNQCYPKKPKAKSVRYPIVIEQEDDDDGYLSEPNVDNTVPDTISHAQDSHKGNYLYEVDYDDDFDGYFKTELSYGAETPECEPSVDIEEEEQYKNKHYNNIVRSALSTAGAGSRTSGQSRETFSTDEPTSTAITTRTRRSNIYSQKEKIHLDLALYTISGIVLIFIMEQFIQIGMKIKAL